MNNQTVIPCRRMRGHLYSHVSAVAIALSCCTSAAWAGSATQLDPIVTTATKTATKLSDVPASVTVITAEDIETQGSASVAQILSRTPGVFFHSTGGIGTSSVVQMRGLEEEHTLVLIDGVRMNDPADSNGRGGFNFESLIPHNIERIEIVRGPMASLYGSNASGGVINIITKKGDSDGFHGGFKAEYGSYATRRLDGNVSYGGKIGDMPFTLAYAHSQFLANGPNVSDEDRSFYRTDIRPSESDRRIVYDNSLDFRLSPTNDVDGRVFFSVNDMSTDLDNSGLDAQRNKDTRTYSYGTVWDTRWLDGKLDNKSSINGMNTSKNLIYYTSTPREQYGYKGSYLQFENLSTYHLNDDHRITAGVSYDRSRAERTAKKLQTIDKTMSHGTGMLQLQSRFFEDLKITAGLSYESYGAFENKLTYRGGAAYDIQATGTTLRVGAGTGYRAPSVFQQYTYVNPKNLKAEETTMYEVGIDQKLLDNRMNLAVTGFRNKVKNQIAYTNSTTTCSSDPQNKCYVNNDEMTSTGIETEVGAMVYEGETDSLDLHVGYTYTVSQFTDDDYKNHASDKSPPHVVNISAIYGFDSGKGSIRADAVIKSRSWVRYHKGSRVSGYDPVYDSDGWFLNLAAQYEFAEGWTAYGRVENLFDSEYYTSSGYTEAPFGVYGGIGYKF